MVPKVGFNTTYGASCSFFAHARYLAGAPHAMQARARRTHTWCTFTKKSDTGRCCLSLPVDSEVAHIFVLLFLLPGIDCGAAVHSVSIAASLTHRVISGPMHMDDNNCTRCSGFAHLCHPVLLLGVRLQDSTRAASRSAPPQAPMQRTVFCRRPGLSESSTSSLQAQSFLSTQRLGATPAMVRTSPSALRRTSALSTPACSTRAC